MVFRKRKKQLRASLIVVLLASLSAVAQNRSSLPQWQEFAYAGDGFAISAPGAPKVHQDPRNAGVTVYGWQFGADERGSVHAGPRPQCMQVLAEFKEALRTGVSKTGTPITGKLITLDGNPGFESVEHNKSGFQLRERVYCVQKNAYAIMGVWREGQPESPMLTHWMDSFRLIPAKGK